VTNLNPNRSTTKTGNKRVLDSKVGCNELVMRRAEELPSFSIATNTSGIIFQEWRCPPFQLLVHTHFKRISTLA
jgi:hypothetical protein